jgi:hypothetical protein
LEFELRRKIFIPGLMHAGSFEGHSAASFTPVGGAGAPQEEIVKLTFILAALAALPAVATPITFTISDFGNGFLNDTEFSDALVTFTQVTDTTLISSATCTYPCAPSVAVNTVTIAGLGTFTLTGDTYFFANGINVAGITNTPGSAYLAVESVGAGTYDMTSNFDQSAGLYPESTVSDLATSDGSLSISAFGATATFQAVVGSQSAIPEPGSLGLALLGAIPLAVGLLRRKR